METNMKCDIIRHLPQSELDAMQKKVDWLECLESAGVDNWVGIDYAIELLEELNES